MKKDFNYFIFTFLLLFISGCTQTGIWDTMRSVSSSRQARGLSVNSGTLDSGFSNDGILELSLKPELNLAREVIVDTSGRILITGETNILQSNTSDMFVLRLTSDGSLDSSFNSSGATPGVFLHDDAGGGSQSDGGYSLAIDSEGRIIIAGYSDTDGSGTFNTAMTLWRLNSNGTPDTTFNAGSFIFTVSTPVDDGNHSARDIKIDSDGNYYVTGFGRSTGAGDDMAVWRIAPGSGTPSVVWQTGDNNAAGGNGNDRGLILVLGETDLYVAGSSSRGADTNTAFWRLQKSNGDLVTAFNSTGHYAPENLAAGSFSGSDFATYLGFSASNDLIFSAKSQLDSATDFRAVTGRMDTSSTLLSIYGTSGLSTTGIIGYTGFIAGGGAYESLCDCILVSGMAFAGTRGDPAVAMLDASGALNTDFGGGDGVSIFSGSENFTSINSIAIVENRYYLTGYSLDDNSTPTTGKTVVYALIR